MIVIPDAFILIPMSYQFYAIQIKICAEIPGYGTQGRGGFVRNLGWGRQAMGTMSQYSAQILIL